MASNQVRDSSSGFYARRGCSKAQMCLHKILHIISTIPPEESCSNPQIVHRGLGFDLNLRLDLFGTDDDEESDAWIENRDGHSASSFVGASAIDKSSEGECEVENLYGSDHSPESETNKNGGEESEIAEDKVQEHSEITITHLEVQNCETENNLIDEQTQDEKERKIVVEQVDCLDLLIEAARVISGNFSDEDSKDKQTRKDIELSAELETQKKTSRLEDESNRRRSKRKQRKGNWLGMEVNGECDDKSAVVKTKRGRSQVSPYRYRDSVLELWRPQRLSDKVLKKQRRMR